MQLVLVNSLLFSLGLLASARVVRRMGGLLAQMRFLVLAALCFPLLYCTTELYTDSFSLAFPSLIIYCALRVMDAEKGKSKAVSAMLWMAGFALLSFIGAQMRFTVIIASIACLIAMLLSRKWLRGVLTAGLLAAALLAGGALVDTENEKHLDPEDMARRAHPILHYIAMGLPIHEDMGYGQYGDGGWYVFTTSFEDPDERRAALLAEVIDRVYYLRYPNRLLNMMSRKNLSTFGDGTFLLNEMIQADEPEPDNWVKQIIFHKGAAYPTTSVRRCLLRRCCWPARPAFRPSAKGMCAARRCLSRWWVRLSFCVSGKRARGTSSSLKCCCCARRRCLCPIIQRKLRPNAPAFSVSYVLLYP